MEKRLTMFLACLFLSVGMVFAQTKVTGTVVSQEDGQPVIGATVLVVGTQIGTATDMNGEFTLDVPEGKKTLRISYVGMETLDVPVRPRVKVVLTSDAKALDEVMVIAYGTQKKSAFTGSAAVVGEGEIGKVQVTNAVDALKGKAAGVQINTATGQPGSEPTIRIRGINSINAGNAPLIVLDGSPYDGSLNDINPIDVESITVLKDAASTALYGARGGNGVVLITTKSAKKGQDAVITVDAKWGSNSKAIPEYNKITSPAGYYEKWYEGLYNYAVDKLGYSGTNAYTWANNNLTSTNEYGLGYNVYTVPEGQYLIGTNGKINPNATLGRVVSYNGDSYLLTPDNWENEIYNKSLRQEYTISATGSNERGTFYASANYLKNEGITKASDYERFTGRIKADYQLKSWLKMGVNASYGHITRNYFSSATDGEASSSGNIFALTNIAPIYPVYIRDANGNTIYDQESGMVLYDYGDKSINGQYRPYLSQSNPLSANQLNTHGTEGNTLNATGTAEVKLPFGFRFTSINNVYLNEYRYTGVTNPYFGQYASSNGIVTKEHYRTWSYNYQQRLDWRNSFGLHEIEAMIGHEYYRTNGYDLWASKNNMFSQSNKELAGAVILGSASSETSEYNTESWIGRVMYNYDEKYFAQVSLMTEASSHFDPDHRWGTFWSLGGGWLINKEKWFKANWIDELKLKASYGENGNDAIGSYRYISTYTIENSNNTISVVPSTLGNKEISWEKNAKFNVGFDFSFWNGRLYGGIEYYANKTTDMLSWFPLPASFGYTGYYANVGNMVNNGIEIDLHGDIIRNKDLTWSAYANLTSNHNEITSLPDERKTMHVDDANADGYTSGSYFFGEGYSRYTYYTKRYAGPDPETGEASYYKNVYQLDESGNKVTDDNGNPIVTGYETTTNYSEADDYICGNVLPKAYGGFGTSVKWMGIDFSIDFQYQLGGKVYDATYAALMGNTAGYGMHADLLSSWTSTNTNTDVPRFQYNDTYVNRSSDRFLTSASYLSLQNITLGYTLPTKFVRNIGLQKVRVYVVGDNICLWSKRRGLDPRQSITGSNSGAYYAPVRTISGGITVTF